MQRLTLRAPDAARPKRKQKESELKNRRTRREAVVAQCTAEVARALLGENTQLGISDLAPRRLEVIRVDQPISFNIIQPYSTKLKWMSHVRFSVRLGLALQHAQFLAGMLEECLPL